MRYTIDIYVLLSFLALGIGAFFLLYLLFNRKYHTWPNLFLALIIGSIGLELWNDTLIHSKLIYEFPWFFKLSGHFRLFFYSTVLIYILTICKKGQKFGPQFMLIYLPFLLNLFFWLPGFWGFPMAEKKEMIEQFYADTRPGPPRIWTNPRLLLTRVVFPVLFLSLAAFRLRRYRKTHSGARAGSFRLLSVLIVGMIVYVLLENVLHQQLYRQTGHSFVEWTTDLLLMSFLMVFIAFFVLKQIELRQHPFPEEEAGKFRKTQLPAHQLDQLLESIKQAMEKEQLFLEPDLSQVRLAEKTGINSSYISQAINEGLRMRFTDFVNQYRIEEAKRMLRDPECANLTIEAIGQQSGFRSKSAFYRAFKKETGQSPGDFSSDL